MKRKRKLTYKAQSRVAFNLRMPKDLHSDIKRQAKTLGLSMNEYMVSNLDKIWSLPISYRRMQNEFIDLLRPHPAKPAASGKGKARAPA